MEFRTRLLDRIIADLQTCDQIESIWEGGSAANVTTDQYSDIDLNIIASEPTSSVFEHVERAIDAVSPISHKWDEPKSIWPELTQKIYFLENAPKHFFVDVAVFPNTADAMISEFMQVERHGTPVVHFDKTGRIKGKNADRNVLLTKQRKRLDEIVAAFPIYRTEVFKEIDRGHPVDAFAFYQSGMVKPLVELLGMLHRPFQFDFGLRYLKRTFPTELYAVLKKYLYVKNLDELRENAMSIEGLFYESVEKVRSSLDAGSIKGLVSLTEGMDGREF